MVISCASHAEAPKEKLDATLKSLASAKENSEEIKQKLEQARKESERLQQSVTELATQLQQSEYRVTNAETRYAGLDDKLAAKQKEFDARAAEYAKTIGSMLRMRTIPTTALLAAPEHIDELLLSSSVLQQVNLALKERASQLKSELAALKTLKSSTAESREALAKERVDLEKKQKKLNNELAERQKFQQALSRDHAQALAKVEELSKQSQSLQELITKLERNRTRIASRASLQNVAPPAAKGSWRLPVAGTVIHRFGDKRNANETWRGLVLRARAGGSVVSPSAGEVVFTGPFRDYGRMVLIKHKDKHISLLAGLSSITVALNQQVTRGEPIGVMGNSGREELYVELREESKPVDPADWYAKVAAD